MKREPITFAQAQGLDGVTPPEPRFKSIEEFEAFWAELAAGADLAAPGPEPQTRPAGFEERHDALMAVLNNKPTNREVLRRVLDKCRERCVEREVEEAIAGYPEYPLVMQPPYRLIKFLIDGGGLERIALGADGEPLSPAAVAGKSADEVDDLVSAYAVQSTDVGIAVADELAPLPRLKQAFAARPDRTGIYAELLEFCLEPRTYADIEGLITRDKVLGVVTYNYEPGSPLKPSVFVDDLERGCGLVWFDHAWHTTDEGRLVLAGLAAADGAES